MITLYENSIDKLWEQSLRQLLGAPRVSPRGITCREITDAKLVLKHATNNLLVNEVRKLSPRFAVAEWLWIFFGHQDVATIGKYSNRIKQFSDDGVSFNGTYGVPIVAQWDFTVNTLKKDPFSRQAVISIFRFTDLDRFIGEGLMQHWQSKDIPCTLTLQFLLRDYTLDCIATMRSSDVWLGLPYDTFNFSMLQSIMAGQLGVSVGQLSLNLGSFHLYETDEKKANKALDSAISEHVYSAPLPGRPPTWLDDVLRDPTSRVIHKWPMGEEDVTLPVWDTYANVLRSTSDEEALKWLRG